MMFVHFVACPEIFLASGFRAIKSALGHKLKSYKSKARTRRKLCISIVSFLYKQTWINGCHMVRTYP
jgi:hypothetical protein